MAKTTIHYTIVSHYYTITLSHYSVRRGKNEAIVRFTAAANSIMESTKSLLRTTTMLFRPNNHITTLKQDRRTIRVSHYHIEAKIALAIVVPTLHYSASQMTCSLL